MHRTNSNLMKSSEQIFCDVNGFVEFPRGNIGSHYEDVFWGELGLIMFVCVGSKLFNGLASAISILTARGLEGFYTL